MTSKILKVSMILKALKVFWKSKNATFLSKYIELMKPGKYRVKIIINSIKIYGISKWKLSEEEDDFEKLEKPIDKQSANKTKKMWLIPALDSFFTKIG